VAAFEIAFEFGCFQPRCVACSAGGSVPLMEAWHVLDVSWDHSVTAHSCTSLLCGTWPPRLAVH